MTAAGFLAVGAGAVLGAWLRWALSTWFNPAVPALPMGTLVSNLAGGFLVGMGMAFFASNTALAPEWRLACITGFLGALTTFSTFSAESAHLIETGHYAAALLHSAAHLFGSLAATFLGLATYRSFA